MINIREATINDISNIEDIVVSNDVLSTISSFMELNADIDKARFMVELWINDINGLVYIAECDNTIIGFILGEIYSPWCSNDKYATDYALYVDPQYRNKRIGIKLLDYFLQQCSIKKVKKVLTGMALNNFNVESMEKLLQRKGFSLTAKYYSKDI